MESGYYVAYAGLAARMQALDIAASNLANVSTAGFKKENSFYRALTAVQQDEVQSPLNLAVNKFGVMGGNRVDLQTGPYETSANELDLAMQGDGFFSVQTSAGIRYTRNGSFRLNAARQVLTQDGDPLLADQGTTQVPITVPTGAITVSPDGTLSVNGGLVAKLHIVQFAPGTDLVPEGGSNYVAPAGSEGPSPGSTVVQGMLETSNINPVEGTIGLILIQRQADMLGKAIQIFSLDFDRSAVQDVPHV